MFYYSIIMRQIKTGFYCQKLRIIQTAACVSTDCCFPADPVAKKRRFSHTGDAAFILAIIRFLLVSAPLFLLLRFESVSYYPLTK